MNISLAKFEEMQRALLEQQEFLLLVQFSRRWCSNQSLSSRATILYAIALMELCALEEAETLLADQTSVDALSIRTDIALRYEKWNRATGLIEELQNIEPNHPRLTEYLSLVRVSKNHDIQRLIRSSLFEQRLRAIEIMMYRGSRQQARVYLEHWKKDRPDDQRIYELHCSAKGDLDFHGDEDELLQEVFDKTHEDDCTQKISRSQPGFDDTEQILLSSSPEQTENQSQIVTDEFSDITQKEGTDSLIEIGHHSYRSEESLSLDEVVLNNENIVLTSTVFVEPEVLLQKEVLYSLKRKKVSRTLPPNFFSWMLLIGVILGIGVGFGFWMQNRAKVQLQRSMEHVILSADMQLLFEKRQVLRHQYIQSSIFKSERAAAIQLLCAVLWYDFTRADEDKECAENGLEDSRETQIANILFLLGERNYEEAEEKAFLLNEKDLISWWVLREVALVHTKIEQSERKEKRFLLQDIAAGYDVTVEKGVLPWIDLELLEKNWTAYSYDEKAERLQSLHAKAANRLGKQNQARLLLLFSILEMEQGNFRKAKYYRMQALERDPYNVQLRYWLGWDHYEEGDLYKASESWTVCEMIQVECAMAQVMVLIDLDNLERVSDLIEEVSILQSRQHLLSTWLEWVQEDIPDKNHPIFDDLLYEHERWRGVFARAEKEKNLYQEKKRSLSDLSWRALSFLALDVYKKDPTKARKIMSMSIQSQSMALSHLRILGWMNKKHKIPASNLWRLYLQKGPTGYAAEKIEKELQ